MAKQRNLMRKRIEPLSFRAFGEEDREKLREKIRPHLPVKTDETSLERVIGEVERIAHEFVPKWNRVRDHVEPATQIKQLKTLERLCRDMIERFNALSYPAKKRTWIALAKALGSTKAEHGAIKAKFGDTALKKYLASSVQIHQSVGEALSRSRKMQKRDRNDGIRPLVSFARGIIDMADGYLDVPPAGDEAKGIFEFAIKLVHPRIPVSWLVTPWARAQDEFDWEAGASDEAETYLE
jgi:hypothetical protein